MSTEPMFGMPIGDWFRWFAWHPTKTTDRGWRWIALLDATAAPTTDTGARDE